MERGTISFSMNTLVYIILAIVLLIAAGVASKNIIQNLLK